MVKIDIISGFLGAGKTTLIQKLLKDALAGQKVVLIENEFGEIGIDGGFLQEAGIEIREMNSGCICCSLVGDFKTSLQEVMKTYEPDRILIEPSGVGKLSEVVTAVQGAGENIVVTGKVAVVDVNKCKLYLKNFGEFFKNQIEVADMVILSRTGNVKEEKVEKAVEMLRELNPNAVLVTTPWDQLDGADLLKEMENKTDMEADLLKEVQEEAHDHHHDHDHDHHDHDHHHEHGEHCTCGCHDHDHEHHDHDHHDHDHHHEHGESCGCGHHHHHADEVFASWGMETAAVYTKDALETILKALDDDEKYGMVLRAKGMLPMEDGTWAYFDYVPGEWELREGKPAVTGKFCVIGSHMNQDALKELFQK